MSGAIVVATFTSGSTGYYTGKAGPEWLSMNRKEAFKYDSLAAASGKAKAFNHQYNLPQCPAFGAEEL
jgi:hypothetical protein